MQISFSSTPTEIGRAYQAVSSAAWPRGHLTLFVTCIYLVVGLGAGFFLPSATAPVGLGLALGGLALATGAVLLDARLRLQRGLASDPHVSEPHHVEVSEAGVRQWCAHVDTRMTWAGITVVKETSEFYVFVRGMSGGPAVPRRVLDPAQEQELRALIAQYAPDRGAHLAMQPTAPVATAAT